MIFIAFDIDYTLIVKNDKNEDVIRPDGLALLYSIHQALQNAKFYIWSGGGVEYAQHWLEKLELDKLNPPFTAIVKLTKGVDLVFDDQDVTLGRVNCQLKDWDEVSGKQPTVRDYLCLPPLS